VSPIGTTGILYAEGIMTIRSGSAWISCAFGAVLLASLGCQPATDVEIDDLDGTWVATEARIEDLEGYKLGNVDLIAAGWNVAFSSPGNGEFTLVLDPPDAPDVQGITGVMEISGTRATFTTDAGVSTGDVFYDRDDHQLALSITGGLTYDFSGNGTEKPAKLLVVMDQVSSEPAPL
jgi:hypothetical protein